MGKSKSKAASDGIPLMGILKPAAGVAVALAGYYFLQGIQTEVRPLCRMLTLLVPLQNGHEDP